MRLCQVDTRHAPVPLRPRMLLRGMDFALISVLHWQVSDFLMRVKSRRFPSIEKGHEDGARALRVPAAGPGLPLPGTCAPHCVPAVSQSLTTHNVPSCMAPTLSVPAT